MKAPKHRHVERPSERAAMRRERRKHPPSRSPKIRLLRGVFPSDAVADMLLGLLLLPDAPLRARARAQGAARSPVSPISGWRQIKGVLHCKTDLGRINCLIVQCVRSGEVGFVDQPVYKHHVISVEKLMYDVLVRDTRHDYRWDMFHPPARMDYVDKDFFDWFPYAWLMLSHIQTIKQGYVRYKPAVRMDTSNSTGPMVAVSSIDEFILR